MNILTILSEYALQASDLGTKNKPLHGALYPNSKSTLGKLMSTSMQHIMNE
jgi:hypothetical protein